MPSLVGRISIKSLVTPTGQVCPRGSTGTAEFGALRDSLVFVLRSNLLEKTLVRWQGTRSLHKNQLCVSTL